MKPVRMTRRGLLMAGGAAWAAQNKPHGVRFGVRSPLPKASLRERAMLVRRAGYDGIELGPEWLNQPVEAIQQQLAGTGAAVSAIVGSIELLDTDPVKRAAAVELDRQRLRMAKQLGADCVIEVPVFGPNKFQDLSPLMTAREVEEKLLVAGLKQLTGDVERTGITLLLEPCNHKETHFMNRQSQAAEIIDAVGAPGFRTLSDFYHMQLEEKDIGETLSRYGKYTAYVHLADGVKRTEPGSLPFDYRPGFRALKKWGYAGWLTVESGATDNPEAALGRALAYLKRQWSEA
ncbi:MAG TPA: sugar phosphate isomerase/epimerase family protein [Bryobacteraceae bacterium]|nr:sugar phosphate isomerase/epimerase family protein [Bryobacteraceae bacterium]